MPSKTKIKWFCWRSRKDLMEYKAHNDDSGKDSMKSETRDGCEVQNNGKESMKPEPQDRCEIQNDDSCKDQNDDSGKDSMKSEPQDRSKVQDDDSGRDRISELSDDVLHHILSYLLSKDIVRTCVLSTRWRSLWTRFTIHTLDFDSRYEPERFLDLVERSKLPIPDNAHIRIFRVYLDKDSGFHTDDKIVSIMESVSEAVKHHHSEELDLTFRYLAIKLSLPRTLFTCQTLTSLKLDMNQVTVTNTNPCSISFPRLKTLHLKVITFLDNCFAGQFFAGCLVLEELILDDCSWNTTSDITIAVPSLQRLSINLYKNLSIHPLIIRCPNLKFFEFSSNCQYFNLVLDLPSLVNPYINIWKIGVYPEYHMGLALRTHKLFERICGVESLRLSFDTLKTICYVEDVLADELPTFHNLTHLELWFGSHPDISASELLHILHKSPKLQSIHFSHGLNVENFQEKTHPLNDDIPVCLTQCLERFSVSLFRGYHLEILLLKQLLKHASVLKSFSVECGLELSGNKGRKEKIRLELKQLCKKHCEFSFI